MMCNHIESRLCIGFRHERYSQQLDAAKADQVGFSMNLIAQSPVVGRPVVGRRHVESACPSRTCGVRCQTKGRWWSRIWTVLAAGFLVFPYRHFKFLLDSSTAFMFSSVRSRRVVRISSRLLGTDPGVSNCSEAEGRLVMHMIRLPLASCHH